MMISRLLIRMLFLLVTSLASGFLVNQWYSSGIPWALLKPRWEGLSTPANILFVSADSAFEYHNRGAAVFIDTRSKEEFDIDHIPGAHPLSPERYYRNPEILNELQKSQLYIFYCFDPTCPEAQSLAKEFASRQFPNIMVLYGGFAAWLEKGYPVEQ